MTQHIISSCLSSFIVIHNQGLIDALAVSHATPDKCYLVLRQPPDPSFVYRVFYSFHSREKILAPRTALPINEVREIRTRLRCCRCTHLVLGDRAFYLCAVDRASRDQDRRRRDALYTVHLQNER